MRVCVGALLLLLALALQGCSVKQDDPTWLQVGKHTINAPLYVLVAIGGVATVASTIIVAPISAPISGIIRGFRYGSSGEGSVGGYELLIIDSSVDTTYTNLYFYER